MTTRRDAELGTLLGIWAHPDDEAYLSAGLMAEAIAGGRRVVCVTATRGEGGFPDDDPRTIGERRACRTAELRACLAELGVTEHVWLDHPDGGCHQVPDDEGAAAIAALISEIDPDTILTFGPDGQTGHLDHIAVGRWTTLAHRTAGRPDSTLLYATATPEWNARMAAVVPLDQVMMVEGMEPPATPVEQLALWYVAEGEVLDRKVRRAAQPAEPDRTSHRVERHRAVHRSRPRRVLPGSHR